MSTLADITTLDVLEAEAVHVGVIALPRRDQPGRVQGQAGHDADDGAGLHVGDQQLAGLRV